MANLIYNTGNGPSEIIINSDWQKIVEEKIIAKQAIIITDRNIHQIYGYLFPELPVIVLEPGEQEKTFTVVESIINKLLSLEVDRSFFLLGIGGGVVCDITGFVASIYMRGLQFGFVSTSLLSQIDASTGGKNGVNIGGFKNIAGCFNQPEFVICDPQMLKTLPPDEYLSGLGELLKYALIKDSFLFEAIENNVDFVLNRDIDLLTTMIETSVNIKIGVVERDELETGERRLLNFGHTFGHAIELSSGLKHGIAVSCGMEIAAKISVEEGLLSEEDYDRMVKLLNRLGLLNNCPSLNDSILEMVKRDKKREKKFIHFILLEGIGKGIIKPISIDTLAERLKN